jgi:PhnB protein
MVKALPVPPGFEGITPYICVSNASEAIEFYRKAFGATEDFRIGHAGSVGHAELTIHGAKLMMSDPHPEFGAVSPQDIGGTPVALHLYVDDVDAVIEQAVAAGAKLERSPEDMFYGDRAGMVVCPYGHRWSIATHIEDVAPDELRRRAKELFGE